MKHFLKFLPLIFLSFIFFFGEAKASQENESKIAEGKAGEKEPRLFLRAFSTTTLTFVSLFTSTVPYTCYRTAAAVANCVGRRKKKRSLVIDGNNEWSKVPSDLHGSLKQSNEGAVKESSSKSGRLFFTVWKSTSTTSTITLFSTNRSVTVSISALCVAALAPINIC